MIVSTGLLAQHTVALTLTDGTPGLIYKADIYCYYYNNGTPVLCYSALNNSVIVNTTNNIIDLPDLCVDTEKNAFIIQVYIREDGNPSVGPFTSASFNTPFYSTYPVPVTASL